MKYNLLLTLSIIGSFGLVYDNRAAEPVPSYVLDALKEVKSLTGILVSSLSALGVNEAKANEIAKVIGEIIDLTIKLLGDEGMVATLNKILVDAKKISGYSSTCATAADPARVGFKLKDDVGKDIIDPKTGKPLVVACSKISAPLDAISTILAFTQTQIIGTQQDPGVLYVICDIINIFNKEATVSVRRTIDNINAILQSVNQLTLVLSKDAKVVKKGT